MIDGVADAPVSIKGDRATVAADGCDGVLRRDGGDWRVSVTE